MIELPFIMASLEIEDGPSEAVASSTRVLRKRRCSLQPTKLDLSVETSYFMSKKKGPHKAKTLATIYEEPKLHKNGAIVHTGAAKTRRINFNVISKDKMRKRKAKVKKALNHNGTKKVRLSMEVFLERLRKLIDKK